MLTILLLLSRYLSNFIHLLGTSFNANICKDRPVKKIPITYSLKVSNLNLFTVELEVTNLLKTVSFLV